MHCCALPRLLPWHILLGVKDTCVQGAPLRIPAKHPEAALPWASSQKRAKRAQSIRCMETFWQASAVLLWDRGGTEVAVVAPVGDAHARLLLTEKLPPKFKLTTSHPPSSKKNKKAPFGSTGTGCSNSAFLGLEAAGALLPVGPCEPERSSAEPKRSRKEPKRGKRTKRGERGE